MYGGVRIEGDNVTFYKNVITIQTRQSVNFLEEIEEDEDFTVDHYYEPSTEWLFHSTAIFIFVGLKISPFFLQISSMDRMCFTCVFSSGENTRMSSIYGGVRIEGDNVTFYKNVITIQTRQSVNFLEEIEEDEDFTFFHPLTSCLPLT